jgi:hypothetical protein
VRRAAAGRRRTYRSYLGWAGDSRLCGSHAERVVYATLERLAGRQIWLADDPPGQVKSLLGQPLPATLGPLDAAGHIAMDPANPSAGFVAFAVEVKNVRGWLYPRDHETWDLMAKAGHFPEVVPILVARRIHPITFRFMRDVGGLGFQAKVQWFSDSIDADRFSAVIQRLGFFDAARVSPGAAHSPLSKWISTTLRKPVHDGPTLIERQRKRWRLAAPIAARYGDLRDETLGPGKRATRWQAFCHEIRAAGLYERGGWAPEEFEHPDTDVSPVPLPGE